MTRRNLLAGGISGILGIDAGACRRKRTVRLAIIPKTTATDYWENLHAGAQRAASKLDYRLSWNAPQSEMDYAQQALMVETAIRKRVDGVVLAASHESVLASSVRHAKAEGIPLVLVDSPVAVDSGDYLAYIGSDETEIGKMAAMRLGAVLRGKGEIAVLGVSPTLEASMQRERSFAQTIAGKFPEIRITDLRYGLSDHIRSREMVQDIVASTPTIKAIFASDSFGGRGAFAALHSLKVRTVHLVAVAQEQDMLTYLAKNSIDALVVQFPYMMGLHAVEVLHDVIQNKHVGAKTVQTPIALATAGNLQEPFIRKLIEKRSVFTPEEMHSQSRS